MGVPVFVYPLAQIVGTIFSALVLLLLFFALE